MSAGGVVTGGDRQAGEGGSRRSSTPSPRTATGSERPTTVCRRRSTLAADRNAESKTSGAGSKPDLAELGVIESRHPAVQAAHRARVAGASSCVFGLRVFVVRLLAGITEPCRASTALHHITAIAGPAQENLDFYAGVLGMRLVKRSVNQDDPGTYHLFYADAEGHPGIRPHVLSVGADGAAAAGLRSRDGSRRSRCRRAASTSGASGSSGTARGRAGARRASASGCWRSPIRTACSVALVEARGRTRRSRRGTAARCRRAADPRPVRRAALGARRDRDRARS